MGKLRPEQDRIFEAMLEMHGERNPDLWEKDGSQREDGGLRSAFWKGYNSSSDRCPFRATTDERAAWTAGKEARRRSGGRPAVPEEEKRHVRTIRLNNERWKNLRALGMPWLEDQIDRATRARLHAGSRRSDKVKLAA